MPLPTPEPELELESKEPLGIHNPIATRRSAYMELITQTYSDNYGAWLKQQAPAKQARIQRKAGHWKHGLVVGAPLTCWGPAKCPFFSACPIPNNHNQPGPDSDYPISLPCALEVEYVGQQLVDYMEHLDVDPDNVVEMSLVNELALLDLLRNRAVMVLSHGDRRGHGRDMLTIDESIVGWSDDGTPLTSQSTKIHPAVEIMDKHEKRRARILEQFVATRASKFKLYGGSVENETELFKQITALRNVMEQNIEQGIPLGGASAPAIASSGNSRNSPTAVMLEQVVVAQNNTDDSDMEWID